MGGDGGSIAQRTELVRSKKKPEQVAREVKDAAKWRYCALSQQPLQQPIVACPLGRLFNKEALIRAMIDKTINNIENAKHITSLKDVKELNLTSNRDLVDKNKPDKGDAYKDPNVAQFICPVVGLEMNGKYRFCVIWNCGCVMSERALKEIKADVCQKCGQSYQDSDIVTLYGTDDEVAFYSNRFEALKESQKAEKAARKAAKLSKNGDITTKEELSYAGVKRKLANQDTGGEQHQDRPTSSNNSNTKNSGSKCAKRKESTQDSTSVKNDKTKSDVFKSLFTSSDSAKSQPKAHWVTYNPLYY